MKEFSSKMQEQLAKMAKTGVLFRTSALGKDIVQAYLNSFTKEEDPVFRNPEFTYHNCTFCLQFLLQYGNIVAVNKDYELISIFDVEIEGKYHNAAKAMSKVATSQPIASIFVESYTELTHRNYGACKSTDRVFNLGVPVNTKRYTDIEAALYGRVVPNQVYTFNHMYLSMPTEFIDKFNNSVASIQSIAHADYFVFERSMEEIQTGTYETTRDLIVQKSLVNGEQYLYKINKFLEFSKKYNELNTNKKKNNFCWVNSYKLPYAKLKNDLIGIFMTDLAEGMDINKACRLWNYREDPLNKNNPTAPFTEKEKQKLIVDVENLGYTESFKRRYAIPNDINVNFINHINSTSVNKVNPISIFSDLKTPKTTNTPHKKQKFEGVQEVNIDVFLKDILPTVDSVQLYFENRHVRNICTLTTSVDNDTKTLFKYNNNIAMTTREGLAGVSRIDQAVKKAGGEINGIMVFSPAWADGDNDKSDLDAHCIEPDGFNIHFNSLHSYRTKGYLRVDIVNPVGGEIAIENIIYTEKEDLIDGTYLFRVHQYNAKNSKGFKVNFLLDGVKYHYKYNQPVEQKTFVDVVKVTLKKGQFTIDHILEPTFEEGTATTICDLDINSFQKVNLICLSPNHWEFPIGNKYHLFMMEKCKIDVPIVPFNTEHLNSDLYGHRSVLLPYSKQNMLQPTDKQLSGLAFNSTVSDYVYLKLIGSHERVIKVTF